MTNIGVSTLRRMLSKRGSARGFVERIVDSQMVGWVIDSYPVEPFSIRLKGMSYSPRVQRLERQDVRDARPDAALEAGFSVEIPSEILAQGTRDLSGLKLYYGAYEVPILAGALDSLKAMGATPKQGAAQVSPVVAEARSARQDGLLIEVPDLPSSSQADVVLEFGQHNVTAQEVPGRDVAAFEIPSLIWDSARRGTAPRLALRINGAKVCDLSVSEANILDALRNLVQSSSASQSLVLLGLEHTRFLAQRVALPNEVVAWALRTAEIYKCVGYVTEYFPNLPSIGQPVPVDDPAGRLKNAAVAEILSRFEANGRPSAAILDQVIGEYQLGARAAAAIDEIMVSCFCSAACFDEISNRLCETRVMELATSENSWEATLSLPFLISRGENEAAVKLLESVRTDNGWINTECLLEASRRLVRSQASFDVKREFLYALIGFIQRLEGQYWTRVYDRFLVGALAVWFEDLHQYPAWAVQDLVKSAIRSMGLSRDFWDQLPDIVAHCQSTGTLHEARLAFEKLEKLRALDLTADVLHQSLLAMMTLQSCGTADAGPAIRELALHTLTTCNSDEAAHAIAQVALRTLGEEEQLRLYAHPGFEGTIPEAMVDSVSDQIATVIARDGVAHAKHASLKIWLGRQIAALENGCDLDNREIKRIVQLAKELNHEGSGWLTADLLMSLLRAIGAEHPVASYISAEAETALEEARRLSKGSAPAIQSAIDKAQTLTSVSKDTPNGLHSDTLVVIYSCRKYLEDRIPRLRETWIADLKARGIPYVILVGDGDDTLEGDVLRLDVADSYEALPDKTLKMIEWVFRNTAYRYLVKIDDDCYMNVAQFFDSLSYRQHNYRGRILTRGIGGLARSWHHSKSSSELARTTLDRSPEPSIYCDGGSAYSLSRYAMRKVVEIARERWGRWLRSVSYMEDKLVGDLLAHASILPNEEDYYVHILRRTHAGAEPATQYENLFFTSAVSPVSITHLDDAEPLADHHSRNKQRVLEPKRIWPSHYPVKLGWNSNQLECLSGADKLQRVKDSKHVVVAAMRNEMTMLPHFLDHYRRLGVDAFLIADNRSDDGSREYLLSQPDVAVFLADTDYGASHFAVDWQQALLSNYCIGKWALIVDADEFLTYDGVATKSLGDLTAELDAKGVDAAICDLVDMYPKGALSECDFSKGDPFDLAPYHDGPPVRTAPGTGHFSNTPTSVTSALRHRLLPGQSLALFMANKVPLVRYWPTMRFSEGIHFAGNVALSPERLFLAHFKYHAGFAEKVETEIQRKQHFGGGVEYQKYSMMLAETRGCLYDPDVSVHVSPEKRNTAVTRRSFT